MHLSLQTQTKVSREIKNNFGLNKNDKWALKRKPKKFEKLIFSQIGMSKIYYQINLDTPELTRYDNISNEET